MRKLSIIAAILVLSHGAFAQVTNFTVQNNSFETLPAGGLNIPCGGVCAYDYGPIPDWTVTGSVGQQIIAGYNNPATPYGNYFAFSNGGTISQTVTTVVAGGTYDLQVAVLSRTELPNDSVVQLEVGNTVVATASVVDAGLGTWSFENAIFTASAGEAGQPLTILLSAPGEQGDFDAVTLTGTNVPEGGAPSLYVLLAGLCCFGAIFTSRKQLASRA